MTQDLKRYLEVTKSTYELSVNETVLVVENEFGGLFTTASLIEKAEQEGFEFVSSHNSTRYIMNARITPVVMVFMKKTYN